MEPSSPNPSPTVLWLTSRSAFERGSQYCPFARYVEYHAGPYGYGIQRKAQSVPLVTGTYAHLGITNTLQWILEERQATGVQPATAPAEVVRWAIGLAIEKYRRIVDKRGILTLTQDDEATHARLQRLIIEQEYLIEGLTWAWVFGRLPQILDEYLIVSVEEEQSRVLDCTCGAGSGIGEISDHEARACGGIGLLSRPDWLGERKSDHLYGYFEAKTTGVARKAWNDSWERKQQFLLGMLGAERRHGVEVSHAFVEGLIKGQRRRDYPYTEDLPKQQATCLCYVYYAPPTTVEPARVRPNYNYFDQLGVKFTAGKKEGYKKLPLWEVGDSLFPDRGDLTISECWARVLEQEYPVHLAKAYSPIGPLPKQRHQIEKAERSFVAEERLWQDRLWRIYEFSEQSGKQWGDDAFMAFVETVVPRSWNCDPYGPDHPCPNQYICHAVTDDWRDPIGAGVGVYRAPHHDLEKAQMVARGLTPEEGLAEEIDEVEEGGEDDYGS